MLPARLYYEPHRRVGDGNRLFCVPRRFRQDQTVLLESEVVNAS